MKRVILSVFSSLLFVIPVLAQDKKSDFLFPEYQDAIVYLSNNIHTVEKVNFNILESKLYFIDKRDGQKKIVDSEISIDSILVGKRKFLYNNKLGTAESLSSQPFIYGQLNPKTRNKAPKVGYDGTSELASVKTYQRLDHTILEDPGYELASMNYIYWIVKDGKVKTFENEKEFRKIYPNKKEDLDKYFKDNKVDFRKKENVIALYKFTSELK